MRAGRAHDRGRTEHGSGRIRAPRFRRAGLALAAGLAAATLSVVVARPATASTLNGIATIAVPGTATPLLSGASTDQFTVSLPPQAACDGDSVHGYHVFSYLVPQGTVMSTITFTNNQPSVGVGLLNTAGKYYGPVDTAITTGQVYGIPNNFEWAPLVTVPRISLSGLLYSGSSGVWEAGLACATSSGALADNWNTEVTFTASSTDTSGFTWSAVPGPSGSAPASFTSASSTTFTVGSAGTFTPTASGIPTPTITESGALPAGVTYSGGVLSGTPTASGTFPITFSATNGIESPATQSFILTVDQAPVITSAASDTVGLGGPITPFTVTATGYPAPTFGSTGDLDGLSLDPNSGVLSGTPRQDGTFPITITATNGGSPDASQQFTLTVTAAPVFTTGTSTTFTEGAAGTFTVVANGVPTPTLSESGALPTGVTFDPNTGLLAGTPTASGTFPVTFSASNGVSPDASQPFTLTVDQHPAITSAATVTFVKGEPGTFTVTATGYPAPTFYLSGSWPHGLHFNGITGVLAGTPPAVRTDTFTFHAANGVRPEASQSFTVKVVPLEITTVSLPPATRGTPYSATLAELGGTGPYTWTLAAGRIPDGLTLSATGRLGGTPRPGDTAGTRRLTVEGDRPPARDGDRRPAVRPALTSRRPNTIGRRNRPPGPGRRPGHNGSSAEAPEHRDKGTALMNEFRTEAPTDRNQAVARQHTPRGRRARFAVTAMLVLVTSVATMLVATGDPASASTLNGGAIISRPGTTTPLTSGGSAAQFTVTLPAMAACDKDTATGGYHVYSYFVKQGTNLSTVKFIGHPSVGSGLFESDGRYYGPVNTAVTTGAVPDPLPNDFVFSELLTHGVTLSALLYTGSGATASGIWETGIACATSTGVLADYWNTQATFKASSTDPHKFVWTDTPYVITTTTLGTATRGVAYSLQLKEEGGTAPFTWTISTPKLPTGLTLSAAGKITGKVSTTVKAGTYKVGFSLKDSTKPIARTTTATLSLVVK